MALWRGRRTCNGQVIGQAQLRHTHVEWLKFLRKIDRQTPKHKTLHLVADNYATNKHPAVKKCLVKHPRFHMHFTPTSASSLNMVERFFCDPTSGYAAACSRRAKLVNAIDEYVAHHNTDLHPSI